MIKGPVLTIEEREGIEKFISLGLTAAEMGDAMNRSPYTIKNEIKRNGGMKNYLASKAQQRYFDLKGKSNVPYSRYKDIEQRLEDLEEAVKELQGWRMCQ